MLGGQKPLLPQKGFIPIMAKKADLLAQAAELKLEVTEKNTIAEIEAAIANAEATEAEAAQRRLAAEAQFFRKNKSS